MYICVCVCILECYTYVTNNLKAIPTALTQSRTATALPPLLKGMFVMPLRPIKHAFRFSSAGQSKTRVLEVN